MTNGFCIAKCPKNKHECIFGREQAMKGEEHEGHTFTCECKVNVLLPVQ